jgi:hypothetical protein
MFQSPLRPLPLTLNGWQETKVGAMQKKFLVVLLTPLITLLDALV